MWGTEVRITLRNLSKFVMCNLKTLIMSEILQIKSCKFFQDSAELPNSLKDNRVSKNIGSNICALFLNILNNHKTLWTSKSLVKNTAVWRKLERFLHFWQQFLLKNHYLVFNKEEKHKIKFYISYGWVGVKSHLYFFVVWIGIKHWYMIAKLMLYNYVMVFNVSGGSVNITFYRSTFLWFGYG